MITALDASKRQCFTLNLKFFFKKLKNVNFLNAPFFLIAYDDSYMYSYEMDRKLPPGFAHCASGKCSVCNRRRMIARAARMNELFASRDSARRCE